MPSDIHEAANTTKEGWIAWFCPLKLYRHYSGCRIWSGLLYRNYIKLYVSFCAARPGFVAYLFVVQYTTAVLYRCFYIRFVLPLITQTKAVPQAVFYRCSFAVWHVAVRKWKKECFRIPSLGRENWIASLCFASGRVSYWVYKNQGPRLIKRNPFFLYPYFRRWIAVVCP